MKTEKELEQMRHEVAVYMPNMPAYDDYEVSDRCSYWLIYTGLLETRYIMGKSFNKKTKNMNTIRVMVVLSFLFSQHSS